MSSRSPSRAVATSIDVYHPTMRPTNGCVGPDAAYELRIVPLHLLRSIHDDAGVRDVRPAVAGQVVHASIAIVVDGNVRRIPIHVPRQRSAPLRNATGAVVDRCPKPADHED